MARSIRGLGVFVVVAGLAAVVGADDPPPAVEAGSIAVADAAGKEQKVTGWSITTGARALGWLAPRGGKEDDKEKAKGKADGPLALVVTDAVKVHFLPGVVTLVPLDRVRSVAFDKEKETMTVRAAVSAKPEEDAVLTGTTAYKGINKLTIRAEVDMGKDGVAEVTYQGGIAKGIKAVRFPAPKVDAGKPGRPALVTTVDQDVKKAHKVTDLQALYVTRGGQERLEPFVMFRKTLKVDLATVKKITASTEDSDDVVWQLERKAGGDASLTLLSAIDLGGEKATFVGLLGKVPAGYLLVPPRRVGSVEFDKVDDAKKGDVVDAE